MHLLVSGKVSGKVASMQLGRLSKETVSGTLAGRVLLTGAGKV
jgi:hypothetical protein